MIIIAISLVVTCSAIMSIALFYVNLLKENNLNLNMDWLSIYTNIAKIAFPVVGVICAWGIWALRSCSRIEVENIKVEQERLDKKLQLVLCNYINASPSNTFSGGIR